MRWDKAGGAGKGGFREKAQVVGKDEGRNNPLAGLFGVASTDGPQTSELGHIPGGPNRAHQGFEVGQPPECGNVGISHTGGPTEKSRGAKGDRTV